MESPPHTHTFRVYSKCVRRWQNEWNTGKKGQAEHVWGAGENRKDWDTVRASDIERWRQQEGERESRGSKESNSSSPLVKSSLTWRIWTGRNSFLTSTAHKTAWLSFIWCVCVSLAENSEVDLHLACMCATVGLILVISCTCALLNAVSSRPLTCLLPVREQSGDTGGSTADAAPCCTLGHLSLKKPATRRAGCTPSTIIRQAQVRSERFFSGLIGALWLIALQPQFGTEGL